MKHHARTRYPEPPYHPRSFWKKMDNESALYFLVLGMVAGTLFAFLVHGSLLILSTAVQGAILSQLVVGHIALALCLIWVISKVFQEIERIDAST